MKVYLQPGLRGLSGQMGDWVYKMHKGKTTLSMRAITNSEPTEAQMAVRERFRLAAEYGKLAMSDPALRALYEQAAAEKDMPVFSLCIADYFNAPSIDKIDASGYTGQAGGLIEVIASDDFGVAKVEVVLTDDDEGTLIESGQAIETGSGRWIYTATTAASAGITVQFQVTATDRPGGQDVQRGTKSIQA